LQGKITRADIQRIFVDFFGMALTGPSLALIVKELGADESGDGTITWEEWLSAAAKKSGVKK
jgi:hypothetical protein